MAILEATRIYQFITNNRASLHLLNQQKVSKYYENDGLQNSILLFKSLLATLVVKNSNIFAGIYFIFLKASYTKLERLSIPNLDLIEKIGKVVIK